MAYFPACLTLLSARPTHCPTRLVHTPALQTPPAQGTSTGNPKEKKPEGVKGKEKQAEAEEGGEEKRGKKGGKCEKEAKKEVEAPLTRGQRVSVFEKVSFMHQIHHGKV